MSANDVHAASGEKTSWQQSAPHPEESARSSREGDVLFSAGWCDLDTGLLLRDPLEVLVADSLEDVVPVLARAAALAENGHFVAGFVAYEAGAAFDSAMPLRAPGVPLAWFGVYDAGPVPTGGFAANADPSGNGNGMPAEKAWRIREPSFGWSAPSYGRVFRRVKHAIHEGTVYQINLTAPLRFAFEGDPLALYRALAAHQPVPFGAYLDLGDIQVISRSPELFFRRRGRDILTRPMKGTIRRGATMDEDDVLEAALAGDAKNRAENLMIVDLLRNDLSRCCEPGSVKVPRLFETTRYRTLIQMTSDVEGRLMPGLGVPEIFRALFPCGSVTGAPKISAMNQIHGLEPEPRGAYCGAIGFMHGDTAVFSVAIRTAVVRDGGGCVGVGSGIVWDSDEKQEFEECLLKARFVTELAEPEVRLIETMRAERGAIMLFELHTDRLRTSARELGFALNEPAYRAMVAERLDPGTTARVRTTLARDGRVEVTVTELEPQRIPWRIGLARTHIRAADERRRHKTTDRAVLEEAYRRAKEEGLDEVLFLNEEGRVAEGSRTNVIAVFGSIWKTPPIRSGALPGVYRRHLLETLPEMVEEDLTVEDLLRADAIYVCNAVRGCIPADLVLATERPTQDVVPQAIQ